MHTHTYACMGGTHPYRDKLEGMYIHTVTKKRSLSHTHSVIQTVTLGQSATMVLAASEGQAA